MNESMEYENIELSKKPTTITTTAFLSIHATYEHEQ